VKTRSTVLLVVAALFVAAGGAAFAFRGRLFSAMTGPAPEAQTSAVPGSAAALKDPAGYTRVKVSRGDLALLVSASGRLEPNTITTIRPDSNMPTRKLVALFVAEGQHVAAGQRLAQIDASGLDLDLQSAQATYDAQRVKLAKLKATPTQDDLTQAQASLTSAELNWQKAQADYDNARTLAAKGLQAKSTETDAKRSLDIAKANYDSAKITFETTKAGPTADTLSAQEASVASAYSSLLKAQLIAGSAAIFSPVAGVVTELLVKEGDLVGPSTAILTVGNVDPMILQALVNENDVGQIQVDQAASVVPSAFPDMKLTGKVTAIDPRATVTSNVSTYQTSIEIPNRDGRLRWGMNCDAEISVMDLRNVLTLPVSAVKVSNGAGTVTVSDEGKLLSWDVQTGATDGTKIQIVAGLDDGDEVLVAARKASTATTTQQRQGGGLPGGVMQIFR